MSLIAEDLPIPASGCRHGSARRTAVLNAVEQFWTTQPTVPEQGATRIAALKQRLANALSVDVSLVSNRLAAKAMQAFIDERFGGSE